MGVQRYGKISARLLSLGDKKCMLLHFLSYIKLTNASFPRQIDILVSFPFSRRAVDLSIESLCLTDRKPVSWLRKATAPKRKHSESFDLLLVEVLFYLLYHHVQAEYHDVVARLNLRVTHYYDTFSIAYQSADGDAFG